MPIEEMERREERAGEGSMTPARLWRRFLCRISDCMFTFFHRIQLVEVYDSQTRKVKCRDCGTYFAMSDRYGAILPWDEDYEQIICDMYGLKRTLL